MSPAIDVWGCLCSVSVLHRYLSLVYPWGLWRITGRVVLSAIEMGLGVEITLSMLGMGGSSWPQVWWIVLSMVRPRLRSYDYSSDISVNPMFFLTLFFYFVLNSEFNRYRLSVWLSAARIIPLAFRPEFHLVTFQGIPCFFWLFFLSQGFSRDDVRFGIRSWWYDARRDRHQSR